MELANILRSVADDAAKYMIESDPSRFDWWKDSGGTDEQLNDWISAVSEGTVFYLLREINNLSKTDGKIALLLLAGITKE